MAMSEHRVGVARNSNRLSIFVRRQEIGRIDVFAGLRPKHDAVNAVVAQDDRTVADLKETRTSGGDNCHAKRRRQIATLALMRGGFILNSRASVFAPAEYVVSLKIFEPPAQFKKRNCLFDDRRRRQWPSQRRCIWRCPLRRQRRPRGFGPTLRPGLARSCYLGTDNRPRSDWALADFEQWVATRQLPTPGPIP